MRLGLHMALKSNFSKSLERIKGFGAETIQIFPGNPTGWKPPSTPPEEIKNRRSLLKQKNIYPLVIHTAYLINPASAKEEIHTKSMKLLRETLQHAELYGAPFVVVHTGSHGGAGPVEGIKKIATAVENELPSWPRGVMLLLENTAGGGNYLGGNISEIGTILRYFSGGPLGFCLDTAHAWAAGYDLSGVKGVNLLLEEIEKEMGIKNLKVIHANDTDEEKGSRRDRHAHIGEGKIGLDGFKALLKHNWPKDLPVILETPEMGTEKEKDNLDALRSCIDEG